MADRPGAGPPEKGTPEYDWLYGGGEDRPDRTRAVRRQRRDDPAPAGDPEATQVLGAAGDRGDDLYAARPAPERPAPPPPPPRRRAEPAAPPPSGPPPAPAAGGRGRGRRRLPIRRVLVSLLLLWLVFLIAVPIWAWTNITKVEAMPDGDRPGSQPGTTYLVVGNDSRADLTDEERRELRTGSDETNLTDTIMLIHTGGGEPVVLSFPRDSQVDAPGVGSVKINSVFARGGAPLLVQTIEQSTGIRIDHYAEIGMGGLAGVVDAVGGIEVCPKESIRDVGAHLDIEAGCQEVDGKTALAYSRARCSKNGPPECPLVSSDLDRVQNQREVVAAVGRRAASPWNVVLPWRYVGLNRAATRFVAVDEDTNVVQAGRLALALRSIGGGARSCTVPVTDSSATQWDAERSQRLFDAIATDETGDISAQICTENGLRPR